MHARLSPSSAYRWMKCPGSPALESGCISLLTSIHALRGSVAHALSENVLTGGPNDTPEKIKLKVIKESREKGQRLVDVVKKVCSVKIDKEMLDHIDAYIRFIESFEINSQLNGLFVEKRVHFYKTFGTVDCFFISGDTLYVIDLKYGMKKIKARNNPQLAIYGLGALEFMQFCLPKNISMNIFQPRVSEPIDTWKLPVKKFKNTWVPKLKFAMLNTKKKKDVFVPGEHCWFCNATMVCPAKKKQVNKRAKEAFKDED